MTINIFSDGVFILNGIGQVMAKEYEDYTQIKDLDYKAGDSLIFDERVNIGIFASLESAKESADKFSRFHSTIEHWEKLGDKFAKNVWEKINGSWKQVVEDYEPIEMSSSNNEEDDNDLLSLN